MRARAIHSYTTIDIVANMMKLHIHSKKKAQEFLCLRAALCCAKHFDGISRHVATECEGQNRMEQKPRHWAMIHIVESLDISVSNNFNCDWVKQLNWCIPFASFILYIESTAQWWLTNRTVNWSQLQLHATHKCCCGGYNLWDENNKKK